MFVWLVMVGIGWAGVPTKLASDEERGEALYLANCWQCHGRKGRGNGPAAAALDVPVPALRGNVGPSNYSDLVQVVLKGRDAMPAYSQVMDRHDAKRILIWVNSLDQGTKKKEKE